MLVLTCYSSQGKLIQPSVTVLLISVLFTHFLHAHCLSLIDTLYFTYGPWLERILVKRMALFSMHVHHYVNWNILELHYITQHSALTSTHAAVHLVHHSNHCTMFHGVCPPWFTHLLPQRDKQFPTHQPEMVLQQTSGSPPRFVWLSLGNIVLGTDGLTDLLGMYELNSTKYSQIASRIVAPKLLVVCEGSCGLSPWQQLALSNF